MKVLILYDYPPSPGGLATQGDLLFKGLSELGVEVYAVHFESSIEKQWYYQWLKPDLVVGVGYWGHLPDIVLHPQKYGMLAIPWLVADGFIANYQDILNDLPLILVTSNWVKEMYVRDGIREDIIEVLPVGCDTNTFRPFVKNHPKIRELRETLNVSPDQLMILTVGGDAASKGGQEVMNALAQIEEDVPSWKYICKVWPQPRTRKQNSIDLKIARQLGIKKNVEYVTNINSRNYMPYLIGACDIYAAPSRLEGFGMPQIEAGACGKPVIGLKAMGMLDTLVHGKTAFLAEVAQNITVDHVVVGKESGYPKKQKILLDKPRTVELRADVNDIKEYLLKLMRDQELRERMGSAGRKFVKANFQYKVVAQQFLDIIQKRLGKS